MAPTRDGLRRRALVGGCGRRVFALAGHDPGRVRAVSTAEYFGGAASPVAPRPAYSVLDLAELESTGFKSADGRDAGRLRPSTHPDDPRRITSLFGA